MTGRPEPLPADYLTGLGGAAVLAAGLTASRGLVVGVVVGAVAAGGLLLRWGLAPVLALLAATYLSLFPDGLPLNEPVGRGLAGPNLMDLLTVAAAVVYAAGHYRYLTRSAESGDEPTADDLAGLFSGAAAAAVVGTAVFLLTTRLRPDYDRSPLRLVRLDGELSVLELVYSRFVLLFGLLGGGVLLAGFALWLVRQGRLNLLENRLLLLDTGWRECRRELARLETWRASAVAPVMPRPRHRRRRRLGRTIGVGLIVAAVTFILVRWALSRLS